MLELNVPDMTCGHCAATIMKAVSGIDQAAACEIDLDAKRVKVTSTLPPSDIVEALEAVGYMSTLVRPAA
jgi:copper chaperone